MGWSRGLNHRGEEVGYGVDAVCAEDGCHVEIDKGLAFCCGGLPAVEGETGAPGCAYYFCGKHLYYCARGAALCERCCDAREDDEADDE